MTNHRATATNWNGKTVEITFRMDGEDFERLCRKAHDAFHRDGKFTIRLDEVDGESVPVEMMYKA